jgi:hypothetical protein
MNYGNGMKDHKSFFFAIALIAATVAGGIIPAAARAGWLADFQKRNAMSSHGQARALRMEAVENAKAAFEKAKAAGAETAAPYEFYSAEEYLKLAKEELDSGDKIGVALFAAESEKYSFEAIEKSRGGRQ